nr:PHB depolymerase family esterase [Methylobacterium sp. BE186]
MRRFVAERKLAAHGFARKRVPDRRFVLRCNVNGYGPLPPKSAHVVKSWDWFRHEHQTRGRGEPFIVAGLTREVMGEFSIDPARI